MIDPSLKLETFSENIDFILVLEESKSHVSVNSMYNIEVNYYFENNFRFPEHLIK